MIDSTTKKGKAAGWTALISGVCALIGSGVTGYFSYQEKSFRIKQDAIQQAQMDMSWKLLRDTLASIQEDNRLRAEDIVQLRIAVAKMEGAVKHLHGNRAGGRALKRESSGLEDIAVMMGAGVPQQTVQLPEELPIPEPERVKKAEKKIEK